MRRTLPYDPRSELAPQSGWVAALGRRVIGAWQGYRRLWTTLVDALYSVRTPGESARRTARRITLAQIQFTGVHAVVLVSLIALFIGATIIIQTNILAPGTPAEMLGMILVAVVPRELAPLITAIVVAGRSGTAIATELGNMRVSSEILALSSLGIDPPRFIVLPRIIAAVVSVLALTVYFSVVAILGGYFVSQFITTTSFSALRAGFAQALGPADLVLFLVKGIGLGAIVGLFSCHYGLQVKSSPTEVPRQASRAVMLSLFGCVAYNTLVTACFYGIMGAPIHSTGPF